jgi:hypothetical protein
MQGRFSRNDLKLEQHQPDYRREAAMNALSMMIRPIRHGWVVQLTDGRMLARFLGPGSKWRALRYVARASKALGAAPFARKAWSPARP